MVGENRGDGVGDLGGDKVRFCPFSDKYCIREKCTLHTELTKHVGGLQQKAGACAFNAMVVMLSEINQKTAIAGQGVMQIPKLYKG